MIEEDTGADKGARSDDDAHGSSGGDKAVSDQVDAKDEHKAEKLTKAGRDIDPNEGAD